MSQINQTIFTKESDTLKVLENITKYCSKCYKELNENDSIYLYLENYEYVCNECASLLSEKTELDIEIILNNSSDTALF